MRTITPGVLAALLLGLVITSAAPARAADDTTGKLLHHVVCLKFKPDATKEQIGEVEKAFRALKDKIPEIHSLTWGTNNSPENRNKGFTHCFVLTFKSEEDRARYLPHPDHKAFGKVLGPVLADVFVIDFWGEIAK
jgi:hypothetical protein